MMLLYLKEELCIGAGLRRGLDLTGVQFTALPGLQNS